MLELFASVEHVAGSLRGPCGSLQDVLGCPSRWTRRNWKHWTFYFQRKNNKCYPCFSHVKKLMEGIREEMGLQGCGKEAARAQ